MSKDELKKLASDVARLSELLTRERDSLPSLYLRDNDLRRAYSAYYLPSNILKIHLPLHELYIHTDRLLLKDNLRILDIGSGPGTAILGAMDFFSAKEIRPSLDFTSVDPISGNLTMARELFDDFRNRTEVRASLKTFRAEIEDSRTFPHGPYNIITISNVLNEIFHSEADRIERRVGLLKDIINGFLSDDGSCIIIEPALRETSVDLLRLRDAIIKEGLSIYSPCLINKQCQALLNPKDWCHEDIPWEPPLTIKEIDRLTGLRKDSLKFSYLVVRKDRRSLADVFKGDVYRVVSDPLASKGKLEFYICGNDGRKLVTRLNKDEAGGNLSFGRMKRGNIVLFGRLLEEGRRFRVGKDTDVKIICQA